MKFLFGAAAGALLLATPSFAQTTTLSLPASACAQPPAAPSLPDGGSANRQRMEEGNEAYQTWYAASTAYVQCRTAEVEALRTQLDAQVAAHNAAVQAANATTEAWRAEVEEFNARGTTERRR
jgi:predicted lipoprotein